MELSNKEAQTTAASEREKLYDQANAAIKNRDYGTLSSCVIELLLSDETRFAKAADAIADRMGGILNTKNASKNNSRPTKRASRGLIRQPDGVS